jgi:hypothetical protein
MGTEALRCSTPACGMVIVASRCYAPLRPSPRLDDVGGQHRAQTDPSEAAATLLSQRSKQLMALPNSPAVAKMPNFSPCAFPQTLQTIRRTRRDSGPVFEYFLPLVRPSPHLRNEPCGEYHRPTDIERLRVKPIIPGRRLLPALVHQFHRLGLRSENHRPRQGRSSRSGERWRVVATIQVDLRQDRTSLMGHVQQTTTQAGETPGPIGYDLKTTGVKIADGEGVAHGN